MTVEKTMTQACKNLDMEILIYEYSKIIKRNNQATLETLSKEIK